MFDDYVDQNLKEMRAILTKMEYKVMDIHYSYVDEEYTITLK